MTRSAFGARKANRLSEHREHPAVERTERALRTKVGVQRVARQKRGRAIAAELLLGETAHGQNREARKFEQRPW